MNESLKKLIRTAQTSFPFLLDLKFGAMRWFRRLRRTPFEPEFRALALFPDRPDAVYVDVGANRGQSTEAILMMTRSVLIHQFEPNPLLCDKLVRLYGGNPRITTHALGLGEQARDQKLFVPFYKRWMFDGLASFDAEVARGWLQGRVFGYRDRHVTLHETTCRVRRLDEFQLKPFFMKLDIQGYELPALKGAEQTIKTHEPVLLIESPPEEAIVRYLEQFGYRMYAFAGGRFVPGEVGPCNTFFMTANRSSLVHQHVDAG